MSRSFVGALAGAGAGFLIGGLGVSVASGGESARDTGAIVLFVGSFLAGMGAIAGAVVGGVADLREFFQRKGEDSEQDVLK